MCSYLELKLRFGGRSCFFCLIFLSLFWLACYSSPFSEMEVRSGPKPHNRYYALQVRFSPELQQYFYQRGCNYSSIESWTVYFSRDPMSYLPLKDFQIPSFRTMKKISDLKLFLPRGSTILDTYHKVEFYGTFPVVTSEASREYNLSAEEDAYIKGLQEQIWQAEDGATVKPLPREATGVELSDLPQVVDGKGLARQKRSKPRVQKFENLFYQPLQRAQSGPRFLNYMLMVGVIVGTDGKSHNSRWELWNLPVILPDSAAHFQYLGELEIGLGSRSAAAGSLLFNSLGQTELRFQVNNYLQYWKPYLDQWLSGSRVRAIQPYFTESKGKKQNTNKKSIKKLGLKGDFTANLLQVVEKPIVQRNFPYVRFEFGENFECRF